LTVWLLHRQLFTADGDFNECALLEAADRNTWKTLERQYML